MSAEKNDKTKDKRDPDFVNAEVAFQRAVRQVRERAAKSGLPIAVLRDGKIVEEIPRKKSASK
ncbi:MAG TPA: hypothetical protein VN642_11720 [Dongiaceae bacterium]|nr:hypothetical protein [Dongiaceae bacterium]